MSNWRNNRKWLEIDAQLFMDNMDDWNNKYWIITQRISEEETVVLKEFNNRCYECYDFVKGKTLLQFSFYNNQYKVIENVPTTMDIVVLCVA